MAKCSDCACNNCTSELKYKWCGNCKVCNNYKPIVRTECDEKKMKESVQ